MTQTSFYVRRAILGHRAAMEWVVARFQPFVEAQVRLRLGATAGVQDREDVVTEVWIVVLRRLRCLRPREGRYAPVLVRFLGTTALNLCNRFLRDRFRRSRAARPVRSEAERDPDDLACTTRGVVTRVAENELVVSIRCCLEQLSESKRHVVVLRLLEQRSNQEIAQILDLPPNTVSVRYRRAIEELRRSLPAGTFDEIWRTRSRTGEDRVDRSGEGC